MSSPLISGCPLLSMRCSARIHCLRLLVGVVYSCASRLVRLIILTASSPGRLLICRSLVLHLPNLPPLVESREVSHLLLDLDPYGDTDPLGMFPSFLMKTADVMALVWCFGGLFSINFLALLETGQCHHNSEHCCQPQTHFYKIGIV